ncbi:MAG: nucleoside phosphorylase [Saprospiraceae bacterium]|nr:nucleoside phosphorylase [Saprospiraceae bacterium]
MSKSTYKDSELILNKDGSVYHLHLLPEHIAETVILVGDQGRVAQISKHFEKIEVEIQNREFLTHTGTYRGNRISVLSTGIGTDNIDIVINELDAAVNFDLKTRELKPTRKSLNLIRIGTSGALHEDIPVGAFVISEFGLGFEGLIYYYKFNPSKKERKLGKEIVKHLKWDKNLAKPYVSAASSELLDLLGEGMVKGITATASGFYGPQGRRLFLDLANPNMNQQLKSFSYKGNRITNFEMETSALLGLGSMLGHRCCTCCAIIANRSIQAYSDNYKLIVDDLIITVLDRISTIK